MLATALDIPPTKIPPLTNGEIRQAMGLSVAECHGWLYLGRELPDGAFLKLARHVSDRLLGLAADE